MGAVNYRVTHVNGICQVFVTAVSVTGVGRVDVDYGSRSTEVRYLDARLVGTA